MSDLHPHALIGELYVQLRVTVAELEATRSENAVLREQLAEKPKPPRTRRS